MLKILTDKVLNGSKINKEEAVYISQCDINNLIEAADNIRLKFCGNKINMCSIISGKKGNCGEDCKFCAQSCHYNTNIESSGFLDENVIAEDCIRHYKAGVHRYSIVTSGRCLTDNDFKKAERAYSLMNKKCPQMLLCASHGLLSYEQFERLKKSGVTRYHCNIETSPSYFNKICTTHSFEDKIKAINAARKVGLEICSGGIIGMGETMEDRIDMAFVLSDLEVNSIPINILTPIKNTPLENAKSLSEEEILRTVAIFRFINPKADIRIAAGRSRMSDNGIKLFKSGASATITGDFLTTTGITIQKDKEMFINNNFEI